MAASQSPRLLIETEPAAVEFIARMLRDGKADWEPASGRMSGEAVLQAARYHGVDALLHDCARRGAAGSDWPEPLRSALARASHDRVAQELLRGHHLAQLLDRFGAQPIRFLLTKGAALARTHYATPGTRTRCDSDVFIDAADVERACQAVHEAGFEVVSPVYKTHQFTVRCGRAAGASTFIDVHWRILNAPRYARIFEFEELWAAAVALPGRDCGRMLEPIHALLLACMHRDGSAWHDRDRLIWLYDIHLLFAAMSATEQDAFAGLAVQRGLQACCHEGLAGAARWFGTPVPASVWSTLSRPAAHRSLAQRFGHSNLGLLVDDWKRLPRGRPRWALLRELFAPPPEQLLQKFGKTDRRWLPWLYLRQVLGGLVRRLSLK